MAVVLWPAASVVVVAGREQEAQDVLPEGAAAGGDHVADHGVGAGAGEATPRGQRPEICLQPADHDRGDPHRLHGAQQGGIEGGAAGRLLHAEHGADDDVERDAGGGVLHDERDPGLPGGAATHGAVADDASVGSHAGAVQRGRQQLALALVVDAIDEDQRILAEKSLQVAGVEGADMLVVGGEDDSNVLWLTAEDDATPGEPALEHGSVAALAVGEVRIQVPCKLIGRDR